MREIVVDSGARSIWSVKKDLRTSRSPTTVMTANGEVRTSKEATIYVKQLDSFIQIVLLLETPTVLSLGILCEDHGVYIPLDQRLKTTSHQIWQEN